VIWLAVLEGVGERGICVHLTLHFCSIVHVAGFAMLVGIFYHLVFFFLSLHVVATVWGFPLFGDK
jgi:hypothetical protein